MRRTKVLLAGIMAVSMAISSAVVPVKAGVTNGGWGHNSKIVAETTEKKLKVDGMYGERLHITAYALREDGYNNGSIYEKFIEGPNDGYITLPIIDNKIVYSDIDADELKFLNSYAEKYGTDRIAYGLDLMGMDGDYDWIDIGNSTYTADDYAFEVLGGSAQKSDVQFRLVNGQFIEWDKDKNRSADNILDKVIVKRVKAYEKKPVSLPEFDVVYSDGSKVEDGVILDIMPDKTENNVESRRPKVKDGKIIPNLTLTSNTLCSIGFAKDSPNSKLYKVVGAEDGFDTVNVFVDETGNAFLMNGIFNFEDKSISFSKITLEKKAGDSLVVPAGPQDPTTENITDDETALGVASGVAVKGKRIAPGKDVKVSDIEVVFEDGTKVSDGVTIDNFLVSDINAKPVHYKVNNGKISGIVLKADKQYKLGFDATNADYNNYEIVGADNSKKFLDVYARYEGGVLLKFDNVKGVEAPEKEISRLVIKKTDIKPSEQKKSKTYSVKLTLSDHGYQPQGVLPFRLVNMDNGKSTPVYSSKNGFLSFEGDAGVNYEIKLDKNPAYKLKDKLIFRFMKDSKGKYQPVLNGYNNPDDLEGRLTCRYIELERLDRNIPVNNKSLDSGVNTNGQKYSLKDFKSVFDTKKTTAKTLPLKVKSKVLKKDIKFEIYNTTKQRVEKIVRAEGGKLTGLKLIKGNDYIISALDKEYSMKKAYVTVSNEGKLIIKGKNSDGELDVLVLTKRKNMLKDENLANRVDCKLPVYSIENAKSKIKEGVVLKFVSPRETVTAKVKNGLVSLNLLEDTNYVVGVEKGNYTIDSIPLTIKSKPEYGTKKLVLNHLNSGRVQALYLINKKDAHKNDTVLVIGDGTTSVKGFRFGKGEYALSARVLKNVRVPELKGKKYEVIDVDTINMYRVELSPLAVGNFKITTTLAGDKVVKNVYYLDAKKKLHKVKFTKKGDKLTFNMKSMTMYDNVIEYK